MIAELIRQLAHIGSCLRAAEKEAKPMTDPFETAEYYDAGDGDTLTHDDPEAALEELIELAVDPGEPEAAIRALGPITVTAYTRTPLPDADIQGWCRRMTELMAEDFWDSFGDGDGDECGLTEKKLDTFAVDELFPVVSAFLRREARVWRCDPVGKRVYSPDECVALMRRSFPEWFEGENT